MQFGDGYVPRIHLFALFHQGLGKLCVQGLLELLYFLQRCLLLVGRGQADRFLQMLAQQANAVGHAIHFAGIAAQQVVAQIKPVLHHLEAHRVSGVRHLHGLLGGSLCRMLALHRDHVDQEQNDDHGQNGSEVHIEFLANGHRHASITLLPFD